MDVKDAIAKAKTYVKEVYADENIAEIELEETEVRDGAWRITVSFSRARPPISAEHPTPLEILTFAQGRGRRRFHRVVVFGESGEVVSMKDRAWMETAG